MSDNDNRVDIADLNGKYIMVDSGNVAQIRVASAGDRAVVRMVWIKTPTEQDSRTADAAIKALCNVVLDKTLVNGTAEESKRAAQAYLNGNCNNN